MIRKLFLVFFAVAVGGAVIMSDVQVTVSQEIQVAQARKRPGIIERLFGPRKKPQSTARKRAPVVRKRAPTTRRQTTTTRRAPTKRRSAAPVVKTVEVSPKDPDARKILVVGDYVASGIAWGLDQTLAEEPRLVVVERTQGSSGLVREDHYDWNEMILGILNEETPDLVVFAIGANDRQDMRHEGESYPVKSPEWEALYTQRIDAVADTLNVYGRPFFWVSVPPMRGTNATADMAYFNSLYRPLVNGAGGHFVDVWNGFTNATGQYITTGPDIDGQNKALRTGDGVNFTSAGKLKLAYYVDRDIRRETGFGSAFVDLLASVTQSSTIEIGPDGKKRLVGPVLSLSDPQPGARIELAGKPRASFYDPVSGRMLPLPELASTATEPEEETMQYRLVVKGEALPTVTGRIDDFGWPRNSDPGDLFVMMTALNAPVDGEDTPAEAASDTPPAE